jgi:DNA (cytosine-5)-methyltransferase 1
MTGATLSKIKIMRFLSICSGIEAASVAWKPLGWKASGFAEIEPFPCAVLAHHYPDVPNHGDMMLLPGKIRAGEVEAPDLLCGGTPCQAFSVAGLRQSLDDARGNLTLTFCEIADAIDSKREQPCIVFWENVPGVLNTKDNAFGCFLGALAGEDDALVAPGGRWANAGFVDGPQRAVAWRVLDAQYFGVAQRRRRVFVVASARADFDPAAVLFEFEGVRRDTAPSREAGQVAPTIPSRSTAGGGLGTDFDCDGGVIASADPAYCLETTCNDYSRADGFNMLVQPVAIQGNLIGRELGGPNGVGASDDGVMYTLTKADVHGVAQPIAFEPGKLKRLGYGDAEPGLSPTLRADAGDNQLAVAQPIAYALDSLASNSMKSANPASGCNEVYVSKALDTSRGLDPSCNQGGMAVAHPVAPTLTASNDPSRSPQSTEITNQVAAVHAASMVVRRLTCVECERLQGFPDEYTNIPWRKQPTAPDGPRYKALGNSWAVPVVRWIGERIVRSLA